jgi:hypothetical protein
VIPPGTSKQIIFLLATGWCFYSNRKNDFVKITGEHRVMIEPWSESCWVFYLKTRIALFI